MPRPHKRLVAACLLACLAAACSASDGGPAEPAIRLVTIGDNTASNPTYATGWASLLVDNDSDLFPAFAGKDLRSLHGEALSVVRLDRGGDGYRALADSPDSLCTCAGDACPPAPTPCVDTEFTGQTIVAVGLGINDVFSLLLRLLSDADLMDDPTPAVDALVEDIGAVIARAAGPDFADGGRLVVLNTYDPTDGTGSISDIAAPLIPFDNIELITPALALGMLDDVNAAIAAATRDAGGTVVDAHGHFLGHGMDHDEPDNPHHAEDDATFWLRGFLDPNLRGAHELRRLAWEALTGERITAIPTDLPATGALGLPNVPDDGWADAVVDSDIRVALTDDAGQEFVNVAADPSAALGPPDGTAFGGTVALGIVGDWLTVDMGDDGQVTEGEGDDLVILELGPASGGTPEPYRVSLAQTPEGPFVIVGDGSAERAFDIASTGLTRARYVRIESLAQKADVLGGVGSPNFPGPEIDAIGAVRPGGP